jgi:hypothetical protein
MDACELQLFQSKKINYNRKRRSAWWLMPVISASWEAEIGDHDFKDSLKKS